MSDHQIGGEYVSLGEWQHYIRSQKLAKTFLDVEALADFLHQQYRAAAKAFHNPAGATGCPFRHDHGWAACPKKSKDYFRRRAAWLLTPKPSFNGRKVSS